MEAKFDGTLRFNGAALARMKELTGLIDPNEAIDSFILKCIGEFKDPQEELNKIMGEQNGKEET